jgi:hypothetical protein
VTGRGGAALTGAVALTALAAACTARDTVAVIDDSSEDREGYCEGEGPSVLVNDVCTGELAARLFRYAVCACGSLAFSAEFTTDGFDSRNGGYVPGGEGGDVGSNVGIDGNQTMTIGGELTVGSDGMEAGPSLEVDGDLSCGGPLGRSSSAIVVDGAARVAGDVTVASLKVEGTLVTRPGATITGEIDAPMEESDDISVPLPCSCEEAVDVAGIIEEHAAANHDAEIELEPDALRDIDGDAERVLPCGRFYVDEISGGTPGMVSIRASGRTALFVGGNITLAQGLTVELEPEAELDLFVAGNIQVGGELHLGDPARPRSLRMYVASGGSIMLTPGSTVAANLFAPKADLNSSAPLEVFGSLVVYRVNGSAGVVVHHDRAIEEAADTCED